MSPRNESIPDIDLHPQALPGAGPQEALAACREFLERCWRKGAAECRVITGRGLHGDGTPRLRQRVEREVLPLFRDRLSSTALEQQGAVILLRFRKRDTSSHPAYQAGLSRERDRSEMARREERLGVARQRFDQAWAMVEEEDWRRARLKVNQLLKEFLPGEPLVSGDLASIRAALDRLETEMKHGK